MIMDSIVRIIRDMGTDGAVQALEVCLKHPVLDIRLSAAYALNDISKERRIPPTALEALVLALKDEHPWIRRSAAEALGRAGHVSALRGLTEALQDEDQEIRKAVELSLRQINDRTTAGSHSYSDPETQDQQTLADWDWLSIQPGSAAAGILRISKVEPDAPFESLLAYLQNGPPEARRDAAFALGANRHEAATDALLHAFYHDRDARWAIAYALVEIRNARIIEGLLPALKSSDFEIRGVGAYALAEMQDKVSEIALVEAFLRNSGDGNVQHRSRWGVGGEAAIVALLPMLKIDDPLVRYYVVFALGDIGSWTAVNPLIESLDDQDVSVRNNAMEALKKICSQGVPDALLKAINNGSPRVRESAANIIGQLGCPLPVETIDLLIAAALEKDDKWSAKWSAANALVAVVGKAVPSALVTAVRSKSPDVRADAAEILGRIGGAVAVEALIPMLRDRSAQVASAAVRALGRAGGNRATKALFRVLIQVTRRRLTRRISESTVIEALAETGDPRLIPSLMALYEFDAASKIQVSCGYYNPELFRTPPSPPHLS